MTDLALARHGETVWGPENRYAGASEVDLSPRGLLQSEQLATWAASAGLAAVWSSSSGRAVRTAAPCAKAGGVNLRVDDRLRELDFGAGEGLTMSEMRQAWPEAIAAFENDPVSGHLPGGEDPMVAAERVNDCLHEAASIHAAGRVLIVAHNTVIRLALCELLGLPLSGYRRLFPVVDNCALTEVRMTPSLVALLRFNAPPA